MPTVRRDTLGRFSRFMAEEAPRQQYPVTSDDVNEAVEAALDPPYTFHEAATRHMEERLERAGVSMSSQAEAYRVAQENVTVVDIDEAVDLPDVAPGAVWAVTDESHVTMREDEGPFTRLLRSTPRREVVPDPVLNIWITVRENKHASNVSLRVNNELIPFETEDVLSWSRHEFEEWANEYLAQFCDSLGNLRHESDWFDTYAWAREQVDARAASFYALKEREASVA